MGPGPRRKSKKERKEGRKGGRKEERGPGSPYVLQAYSRPRRGENINV